MHKKKIPNQFLVTLTAETHERAVRECDAGFPRVDPDVGHEPGTSPFGGAAAAESHHEAQSVFLWTSCQQGAKADAHAADPYHPLQMWSVRVT